MPRFQKVCIPSVPGNAMLAFQRAAVLTNNSVTDVINWCIQMVAEPGPLSALYWVVSDDKGGQTATEVNITPIPPDADPNNLTVYLLNTVIVALATAQRRYHCDETGVLARAAWLAPYYKATNGHLASGRVYAGRRGIVSVSTLRFLT